MLIFTSFLLYCPYTSAEIEALYFLATAGLFGKSTISSSEEDEDFFYFCFYFTKLRPYLSNHAIDQSIFFQRLYSYNIFWLFC